MPSPEERAALLDTIEADLADVELALARLDATTYDACEACGSPIPDEVLATRPVARRCASCG